MSEFTSAILVKDSNIKMISNLFKKLNLEGYIFPLNSGWHAIVMEEFFSEGLKITKDLSSKLNTYVFSFYSSEDDGWGYTLFYNGEQKGELYIEYEGAESFLDIAKSKTLIERSNISLLTELSIEKESLEKFEDYLGHLNHLSNDDTLLFEGVEYFKEAFCFQKLSWVSYEYFQQLKTKEVKEMGAVFVGKKKINLKKTILKVIGERLSEYGYYFDKEESGYTAQFEFLKVGDSGFKEGLILGRDKICDNKGGLLDVISAEIRTPLCVPSDLFYIIDRKRRVLSYSTEEELVNRLEYILQQFIDYGIKWLNDNKLIGFDVHEIYKNTVDDFFKKYSFEKVHIDKTLPVGGKVEYSNGELSIIFDHSRMEARFICWITENNNMQSLYDIAKQYRIEKRIEDNRCFSKDDYINYLQACLHILERYYFPNKNIGDIIYNTGQNKKSKIVEFPRKKD